MSVKTTLQDFVEYFTSGVHCVMITDSCRSQFHHRLPVLRFEFLFPQLSSRLIDVIPHRRRENNVPKRILSAKFFEHTEVFERCSRRPVICNPVEVEDSCQLDVAFVSEVHQVSTKFPVK